MNYLNASRLVLAVSVIGSLSWLVGTAFEPLRANWGDPISEFNAHTSGLFFQAYGFIQTKLQPILDARPLSNDPKYYTHYPPLPDWLDGVLRILFNFQQVLEFRLVAIMISFGGIAYFYLTTRRLLGPVIASTSTALWVINPLFLEYADLFHHIPLYTFFGWGTLYWFVRYINSRNRYTLIFSSVYAFMTALSSYDYDLFLPITLLGLAILLTSSPIRRVRRLLAAFVIAITGSLALLFRFGVNTWALGFNGATNDIFFQISERSTSQDIPVSHWVAFPSTLFFRLLVFYSPVFFIAVAVFTFELYKTRRNTSVDAKSFRARYVCVLLVAGLLFLFVFSELTVEQYPPMLLLLPFYSTAAGIILVDLTHKASRYYRRKMRLHRSSFPFQYLIVLVLIGLIATSTLMQVTFPKAFVSEADFLKVRQFLDSHDSNKFILTNGAIDSIHRYYLNRDMISILTIPKNDQLAWVKNQVYASSSSRVFFLYYRNVWDIYYDKTLFSTVLVAGHVDWYSFPELHKQQILDYLRTLDIQLYGTISTFGQKVLDLPSVELWEVSDWTMLAGRASVLQNIPTKEIDFGTSQTGLYLGKGFRYNEVDPHGRTYNWANNVEADMIVNLSNNASHNLTITIEASVQNQSITVFLNTIQLGSVVITQPFVWENRTFGVSANVIRPGGWQLLEFVFSTPNDYGLYMGFSKLVVDS